MADVSTLLGTDFMKLALIHRVDVLSFAYDHMHRLPALGGYAIYVFATFRKRVRLVDGPAVLSDESLRLYYGIRVSFSFPMLWRAVKDIVEATSITAKEQTALREWIEDIIESCFDAHPWRSDLQDEAAQLKSLHEFSTLLDYMSCTLHTTETIGIQKMTSTVCNVLTPILQ